MAVVSRHWCSFQLQGVWRLAPGNRYPGSGLQSHPGTCLPGHALVSFKVEGAKKPPATVHPVQRRAWSRLSHDAFAVDLQSSVLCRDLDSLSDMSVDGLVSLYDSTFTGLLDKHCPLVTVRHKVQPMTPWFDAECRATRRRVRAAERRYKRTFLEVDKRAWSTKRAGLRALYE